MLSQSIPRRLIAGPGAWKLARGGLHLALGCCIAVVYPLLPYGTRCALLRWWSRGLLKALGVSVHLYGLPCQEAALVVSNHVSWLDVLAICSVQPLAFVCKDEVSGWPIIGWIARRAGTVFLKRGNGRQVLAVSQGIRCRLSAGERIGVFPEATTSAGTLLPFHPALFQAAVDARAPVYPVAISYSDTAVAYVGEASFLDTLRSIVTLSELSVAVNLLPRIGTAGLTRREAARRAQQAIAARLHSAGFSRARRG